MGKLKSLYAKLLSKQETDVPAPPKGYARGHNITSNGLVYTKLFRLASAKETIKKEGVGKVSVFVKDGENYAFVHELGMYIFAGDAHEKPIETVVNAINNVKASVFTDIADQIKNTPKPFVRVVSKDTVAKIKKLAKLMNSKPRDITDTLLKVEDGIVTISDSQSTVISKTKFDIPNIIGMSIKELGKMKDELYVDEEGRFSGGEEFIATTLDFEQVIMVDMAKTDLTIKITQPILKSLQTAVKAVDNNNPKFELNGLLLDVMDGKAKAVGTDTRRLTVSKEFDAKGKDGHYIILPQQVAKDTKVIKTGESSRGNTVAYSETDEYELYTRSINGRYPDYQRIIPQYPKHEIKFNSKELVKAIKKEKEVVIQLHRDKIDVLSIVRYEEGAEEAGEQITSIPVIESNCNSEAYAVTTKYVVNAIENSKTATLAYNGENSNGRNIGAFKVTTDDDTVTVIMPITLTSRKEKQEQKQEAETRQAEREAERISKQAEYEMREKEEQIAEEGIAHEFLNTLEPKRRGSAKKTLLKQIRYDGSIMDKKDFVKALVEKGYKPQFDEWKEYSRRLERDIEKSSWALHLNGENSSYDVTKTEAQLAQHLIDGTTLDSIDTAMGVKESILTPNENITIGGIAITIESKRGQIRRGIDADGNEWSNELQDDYGHFDNTLGADGDEIDVFICSDGDNKIESSPVFILKQNNKDGSFDEDKIILNTPTLQKAKEVYYRNYSAGYKNSGEWYQIEFGKLKRRLEKLSSIYERKLKIGAKIK